MREIKFRVWDNRKKVMFYDVQKTFEWFDALDYPRYYTLMQYTGIVSMTGFPVYENDIISFRPKSSKPPFYVVKYDFDRACFLPYNLKHKCFLEDDEDFPVFLYSNEVRIVGNVFENSELLK